MKVSIIVPIYNAENYIQATVKSILNQTFSDFELILVDDGSTDNSLSICQDLSKKDERIKVVHKENGGSSSAKNVGMEHASGEYIGFVDADDTIDEDYINNLYQGVSMHQADVCVGNMAFVCMKSGEIVSRRTVEMTGGFYEMLDFMKFYPKYMSNAIIGSPCNKLYRRNIIDENSIKFNVNIRNNEDTHFNYEYLAKCKSVFVSAEPFYNYINRAGVESSSTKYIENVFDIYVQTYKKAIAFLKDTNTYDSLIKFQSTYFINLVIGALNSIVNKDKNSTKKEKKQKIEQICNHSDVVNALSIAKVSGFKKKIIVKFMKQKWKTFLYFIFSAKKS